MLIESVLLIDDEELIRRSTQVCLQVTSSWKVLTASSGAEGVAMAVAEQPDVILLDLMMPVMDGWLTVEQLKNNPKTQHIPVLLLTAKGTLNTFDRSLEQGLAGVIIKPFDPLTLADQIRAALSRHHQLH